VKRTVDSYSLKALPRRGVTLIEMLVTVAVLVLMMTVLTQIFQAATGALSSAREYQNLDNELRQLNLTILSDLGGVTARLTPPLNPKDNLGYFEYGENEFADLQGEDSDDYLRFTAKAPDGQPFTGRAWVNNALNQSIQPITVTSQYAEIIYFLRNGNLYRRVLLIAPDRQSSIAQAAAGANQDAIGYLFYPTQFGGDPVARTGIPLSWQGVNDLSAHPARSGPASIVLNTLGDLTNRENRFASPRFSNDYFSMSIPGFPPGGGGDGFADDLNSDGAKPVGDGVPDYYPTLYPLVFSNPNTLIFDHAPNAYPGLPNPDPLLRTLPVGVGAYDVLAFPFMYPGAYSAPDPTSQASGWGWVHSLDPGGTAINHSPLDLGESPLMPLPTNNQTWWGFPTWRETLSATWNDPTWQLNWINPGSAVFSQPQGLQPVIATSLPSTIVTNLLPPMTTASTDAQGNALGIPFRLVPQPYNDGSGNYLLAASPSPPVPAASVGALWAASWEDDLIMTGVRSFDVKAYDNAYAGYVDLGWGDNPQMVTGTQPFLSATPPAFTWYPGTFQAYPWYPSANQISVPATGTPAGGTTYPTLSTMAHEGRMPPRFNDHRLDAQFPNPTYVPPADGVGNPSWTPQYGQYESPGPNYNTYTSNIGDDQNSVIRLRRVWDSWSTDYSVAPSKSCRPDTGLPYGPPFTPPTYPSYPPPYPAPLRGIQIQVRVIDPSNKRVKVMTIRRDFTDKL
jgi:prepilin-type N-terminal cleavage/methylation domain-containing protein